MRIKNFAGLACFLFMYSPGFIQAQSIIFSEMMYHPAGTTHLVDEDEYEFLEIQNIGNTPFDLDESTFTKGIDYSFSGSLVLSPGAYILVVKNRAAFSNRYPAVTNIAPGVYTGSLANNGEKVTLKDPFDTTLFSVTYNDNPPWPKRADGHGASLVLTNATGDPDDSANWCSSDLLHGKPGQSDTCWSRDVVINEALSHTDTPLEDSIELYNLTPGPIDIGGWYLSDDTAVRNKYRIPDGTIITGRAFQVFLESQFNDTNDSSIIPFSLSELGDRIYLTEADSFSNLTRFVDYVDFDASENGFSFGLYPDGSGAWVTLAERSLGSSNTLPRVGPVVISEIMYHPPNDNFGDEYIELLNISDNSVPLFDPSYPTNTWLITNAVHYMFPTGITMSPGERILLTGTTNIPLFRSSYGLDSNTVVLGSWSGRLNNAGETIELYKPGTPETNLVPYILVDKLDYGNALPWPEAPDGKGPSLERTFATNYGNTAANWFAGAPGGSPGTAPVAGLINPMIEPVSPSAGQVFTVTVSVVAQTLPTQVVLRTSIDDVRTDRVMTDDGTGADKVSGDLSYSVALEGQADGSWVYYQFRAFSTNSSLISSPPPSVDFPPSPSMRLQIAFDGLDATVQPTKTWTTYDIAGTVSHTQLFSIFLLGSGETLLDDLSVKDVATLSEHIAGGDFESPLPPEWYSRGNHTESFREDLESEEDNGVLHIISSGSGATYGNAVNVNMTPTLSLGEPVTMQFRARRVSTETEQWFSLAIGTPPPDVVINEIMYHPNRPEDQDENAYEYVELFNPAGTPADLSYGHLSGAGFTFPSGTVVGANGYLVLCSDTNTIAAEYGITNLIGNWTGQLLNSGETLNLVNPFGRILDQITYNDKTPWPTAPDGTGPSLERIAPASPGFSTVNWASSRGPTNWVISTFTVQVTNVSQPLTFFVDADSVCFIDSLSFEPIGPGAQNLLTNGNFDAGFAGWTSTGNHFRSRSEPTAGFGGSPALAVAGTFSRWVNPSADPQLVIRFGDAISNNVYYSSLSLTNNESYRLEFRSLRKGLAKNLYALVGGVTNVVSLSTFGTPGGVNSAVGSAPSFEISAIDHTASRVSPNVPNKVTARFSSTNGLSTVRLKYRLVATNDYEFTDIEYEELIMTNSGAASFAADIPGIPTNWVLVRYHVTATDTNGVSLRIPGEDDSSPDYGYWVDGGSPQSTFPNWHVLIDGRPINYPITARGCAISPDGQIFTDIVVRHRGGASDNPLSLDRTGLALRFHNDNEYDAWFANNQGGINLRHRKNDFSFHYKRIVNEPLAYEIQKLLGLATPRLRYVCAWLNGEPTITTELEDPGEAFLTGNNLSKDDFLSRGTRGGRRYMAGDPAIDNLDFMVSQLNAATGATKTAVISTNLYFESVRQSLSALSVGGDHDQNIYWNMFEHRRAVDGRWTQYPWDNDLQFRTNTTTISPTTTLHPYYKTPLHPHPGDSNDVASQLTLVLFYPENGLHSEYTLPYRHRLQKSLWRLYHTIFTTNYLYPKLDSMYTNLLSAHVELNINTESLGSITKEVKDFIPIRRDFYMNGDWSDKDTNIWNIANVYDPGNVVINEIMADPILGGEYLELYNTGTQTIDLSHWKLVSSDEEYHLPLGSMLGPTSYLVIADSQPALSNAFYELSDDSQIVRRYPSLPIWDEPIVWTTATEYATRIIQLPQITLPRTGASLALYDLQSNLIDSITYSNLPPWTSASGISLELTDPTQDNENPAGWRLSSVVGTPGWRNSSNQDKDQDGLGDDFEDPIVAASGGVFTNISEVLGEDDFDMDGISNGDEFILGRNPIVYDSALPFVDIQQTDGEPVVFLKTVAATGSSYQIYSGRYYTLQEAQGLTNSPWTNNPSMTEVLGTGSDLRYTNGSTDQIHLFRSRIKLKTVR